MSGMPLKSVENLANTNIPLKKKACLGIREKSK
jgi:hypothetical protein